MRTLAGQTGRGLTLQRQSTRPIATSRSPVTGCTVQLGKTNAYSQYAGFCNVHQVGCLNGTGSGPARCTTAAVAHRTDPLSVYYAKEVAYMPPYNKTPAWARLQVLLAVLPRQWCAYSLVNSVHGLDYCCINSLVCCMSLPA